MIPTDEPIPMLLWCPVCGPRHIEEGEFITKPHHTHACQYCGLVWRPAIVPTRGVQFLPTFKNETGPPLIPGGGPKGKPLCSVKGCPNPDHYHPT